jgi:glucose-6-phosphate isomerase
MLEGANAMDLHFRNTEFEKNIPVIMALLGVWYNNFFGFKDYGVIPYDQDLRFLPKYLQQLDMKSNGKSVDIDNRFVKYSTGPVIFGGAGTDVQHSFFQLLHQGTNIVPLDFIVPAISHNEIGEHHEILVANALAQCEALMRGKTVEEATEELTKSGKTAEEVKFLKKYKSFPGNRPTNTIVVKKVDPYTLGMLVAMYEHKVFVHGVIWNIDSFDQMGVELGKQMALSILPELQGNAYNEHDSSTSGLISLIKKIRK